MYRIALQDGVAHLATAPFYDTSTVVPDASPRFADDFILDSQDDQQANFASQLGADDQRLQVLSLRQSVDDTAFATRSAGHSS